MQLVFDWIALPQVKGVFAAPPCGTASLARNIQDPNDPDLPQPLRSWDEPDGLQGLSETDFVRVGLANILYEFTSRCSDLCKRLGKFFVCENPRDSLFWRTTPWTERELQDDDYEQAHQACAYGSKRPKWTKLVGNVSEILGINLVCPGGHFHEPWGKQNKAGRRIFATALEVHYPTALCDAIASAFVAAFLTNGWSPQTVQPAHVNLAARIFSEQQPVTNKVLSFLPDYKHKFVQILHAGEQLWPFTPLSLEHTKLLHEFQAGGTDMQQLEKAVQLQLIQWKCDVFVDFHCNAFAQLVFPCTVVLQMFGKWWTEEEFVERAINARHPLSVEDAVPLPLLDAIDFNLKNTEHEIALFRTRFLAKWTKRASELHASELELKQSMDESVAKSVKSKRILLFEEMLLECGFPDMGVVDELRKGAELVGEVPATNMLPCKVVPALSTTDELACNSKRVRHVVESDARGSGNAEVDQEVWSKTMEEVEKGWLWGPLSGPDVPDWQPVFPGDLAWFKRKASFVSLTITRSQV